jgi:predicted kinase
MPKLYMLIGVPASGKSTWRAQHAGDAVIVSSDDIIYDHAAQMNKTYSEVFTEFVDTATRLATEQARAAFAAGKDVVWDQTNLTPKSRKTKLAMVPDDYERIAVVFATPAQEEWQRRLASRPGKSIPWNVLWGMDRSLADPIPEEGFHEVIFVA